ncbi:MULTISPECIES: hypothetical protein [Cupriavidus]|uniref:hypothetical protein n=1 Tax=Cupriavidus sp. 30B13 TaxID=3384241 RepID=UPI003B917838
MHLEHFRVYGAAGFHYESTPNPWVVVDDYGTEHDDLGNLDVPYHQRQYPKRAALLYADHQDPDFFHASTCTPRWYRIDEATAFSTPIGLSIEGYLRISFQVNPHWDEQVGDAYYERDRGARLELLEQSVSIGGYDSTCPIILAAAELEEFCWQYIELERAREQAKEMRRAADAQARRSSR